MLTKVQKGEIKKVKKILSIALVVVLLAGIAVSGTMAYLTDTDSEVNVMTLGNVKIEQIEQERGENGELQDFTQDKPLYPAVYDGTSIPWAAEDKWVEDGKQAWKVVADNENVVDKFVTVKNTGKSDAYVRTLIAYEGDETYGPEGAYIHIVINGTNVDPQIPNNLIGVITVNDVKYTVYEYVYPEALAAGETTIPSLKQVYLDKTATNEVCEVYGDTYDILVLSQAVQTAGFDSAAEALTAGFGEVNEENVQKWFKDVGTSGDTWDGTADITWYSEAATELKLETAEAVAGLAKLVNEGNTFEGKTITLDADLDLKGESWTPIGNKEAGKYFTGTFDGNGHTVSGLKIESGDYVAFIGAAKDAVIKNVTVEGTITGDSAAGVVARVEGNTTIESCVNNADVTSTDGKAGGIACNVTHTGSGTAIFTGCVNNGNINGPANAGLGGILGYANTDAVVEMTNCKNNGDITATNDTVQYVGAAIGYAAADSKGEISGFENSGALNGGNSLGDSLNRYLVQDSTVLAAYCGTPANWTVS